jgi:hypothetical protein
MHPADLETLVGRELRQLPLPRAPQTLLPRVLAAVQAWGQRPWYERAWFSWPPGWQLASIAVLLLSVGGGAVLLPATIGAASAAAAALTEELLKNVAPVAQRAEAAANAAQVIWRALLQPLVTYAFALVVVMCVACAAFGAALNRVVFERA